MRFIVSHEDDKYIVKDTREGWFISAESEINAELIKEKFEELTRPSSSPNTIEDFFGEWEKSIEELSEKETEAINLKETYAQLEQEILENTDFKEIYGANNQKIRDNHIKNELKDLVDKKHDLQLRTNYLKRRIEFIKSLMRMQGILIDCGVIEE